MALFYGVEEDFGYYGHSEGTLWALLNRLGHALTFPAANVRSHDAVINMHKHKMINALKAHLKDTACLSVHVPQTTLSCSSPSVLVLVTLGMYLSRNYLNLG